MNAILRAAAAERELQDLRQSADVLRNENAALSQRLREIADSVTETQRAIDARHSARLEELRQEVASASASAQALFHETSANIARVDAAAGTASASLDARTLQAERAIAVLAGRLDRIVPPFPDAPKAPGGENALMAVFEEMFRGTVPEISERITVHIDDIVEAVGRTGCRTVVDVGCGRGEWLELMRARDIQAIGLETSAKMVELCKAAGHDAREIDALAFLRSASPASYAAVTAFHVVEHLPVATVLAIAIEAARALLPGGVMILETPNPDNVLVGSSTFWLDPTHLRPLPPRLLRFLVEAAGFEVVDVRFQGPDPDIESTANTEGWPAGLKRLVGGPRDYAIIARKPEA